ncbi:MAG: Holliday junction branch migration protein RuvA, partial [Deltaproteobacteria bacterium]
GFPSIEERDLFRVLISVPGIGPRLGLTLLSECPPAQLTTAIREENVKFLASFKGIGKKTAERIVLELKEKIPLFPGGESAPLSPERTGILADAVSGLVNFGFPAARAEKAVRAILARQETTDTVEVIRAAFKELSR